tara:strand:+ start:8916 stop:9479 length:564 start_codon:yes stop_codon:yes gene_type:complete
MIRLLIGDITKLRDVEVIVNAANGIGVMGAGVAGAIARSGGEAFCDEVREIGRSQGPFAPGSVYASSSGAMNKMGIQAVYHAVTMMYPGTQSSIDDVVQSVRNTCKQAIEDGRKSIAFPGLGTGIGGLNKRQVAQRMATVLFEYHSQIDITVVDINEDFVLLVKEALGVKREPNNDLEPEQANSSTE